MVRKGTRFAALAVGLALTSGAEGLAGQSFTIAAGVSTYDLSGTGTEAIGSVRVDGPVATGVRWQAGLGFFRYEAQFGDDRTLFLPEAGLEWRPPVGGLPLYVGAGVGANLERGPGDDDATVYGALGLDLGAGDFSLRPEMRLRTVDPWAGTMADFTLGLRFGR